MNSNVVSQEGGSRHALVDLVSRRAITPVLVLAVLFPVFVGAGILYRQAITVPYQDDYNAILAFAADYSQLSALKAKALCIIAEQHNEYKLIFEHSIVASEFEFAHHLNFAFLIALGDLFLLPIGYLLWRMCQEDESDCDVDQRLVKFLPVSFLFFALSYWENLNWAMTGLQNIPVIFFGLLAIYLLASRKTSATRSRFAFACLAAALAACTSANGFFLGPIGLLILLPRRAYAKALIWCASLVGPLIAYLYHYTPSQDVIKAFAVRRPFFFLAFLGGVIPFRWPATLLGLIVLAIIALAVRSRFDRTNPVAFYFMIWIVVTDLLVSWVRGGFVFGVASRYSMYSCLLLIFCYLFLAQYLPGLLLNFNRRRFYVASVLLAATFCLAVDAGAYKHLRARRRMVLTGIELYRANPETNSPMIDPEVERLFKKEKGFEQVILTRAIKQGIYTLPPKQELR